MSNEPKEYIQHGLHTRDTANGAVVSKVVERRLLGVLKDLIVPTAALDVVVSGPAIDGVVADLRSLIFAWCATTNAGIGARSFVTREPGCGADPERRALPVEPSLDAQLGGEPAERAYRDLRRETAGDG